MVYSPTALPWCVRRETMPGPSKSIKRESREGQKIRKLIVASNALFRPRESRHKNYNHAIREFKGPKEPNGYAQNLARASSRHDLEASRPSTIFLMPTERDADEEHAPAIPTPPPPRERLGAGGGIRTRRGPFLRSRRTLTTLVVYERYPGASRMATSTLRHIFSLHCRSPRPPDVPTLARVPNGIGGRS